MPTLESYPSIPCLAYLSPTIMTEHTESGMPYNVVNRDKQFAFISIVHIHIDIRVLSVQQVNCIFGIKCSVLFFCRFNEPNSNLFQSLTESDRYILAQTPLPGTVDDFLTLIYQEDVKCIVSLDPQAGFFEI